MDNSTSKEAGPVSPQANKLAQALRRQPRGSAALALLLVLIGVLLVRYWIGLPGNALGADARKIAELSAGDAALKSAGLPNLGRGARLSAQWRISPAPPTIRNLFVSDLNRPPAKVPEVVPTPGQGSRDDEGLFWRQLERVLAERTDRESFRKQLAAAVLADATKLTLTSIMTGPESRALLSGQLVGVGSTVASPGGDLTVVAVEQRHVVLARDGQRVVLVMGKAGAQLIESR